MTFPAYYKYNHVKYHFFKYVQCNPITIAISYPFQLIKNPEKLFFNQEILHIFFFFEF